MCSLKTKITNLLHNIQDTLLYLNTCFCYWGHIDHIDIDHIDFFLPLQAKSSEQSAKASAGNVFEKL